MTSMDGNITPPPFRPIMLPSWQTDEELAAERAAEKAAADVKKYQEIKYGLEHRDPTVIAALQHTIDIAAGTHSTSIANQPKLALLIEEAFRRGLVTAPLGYLHYTPPPRAYNAFFGGVDDNPEWFKPTGSILKMDDEVKRQPVVAPILLVVVGLIVAYGVYTNFATPPH